MSRSIVVGVVATALLGPSASGAQRGAPDSIAARATHALSRLTFGPRPGDVDRVLRLGLDRWIDQQLHPESIADTSAVRALTGRSSWTDSVPAAAAALSGPITFQTEPRDGMNSTKIVSVVVLGSGLRVITRDSARKSGNFGTSFLQSGQLLAGRLTRAESSDQQLLEVMTDFWENHFSLYGEKLPSRGAIIEWDRAVIRAHALGRFRDLLGAVAHSPAMLTYLDNAVSTVDTLHASLTEYARAREFGTAPARGLRPGGGLNENFGRELLELHTLGVDGGYSQRDVIEVARAFTGWTHSRMTPSGRTNILAARPGAPPAAFFFDSTKHDADAKVFLGTPLPAGRGIEDGEQVLDMLARHPSTARFIARKLAVRLVSDAPPAMLVDRATATYLRTNGDIREVVRTIVTSPEFYSADAIGAKVKTPVELVLSTRRALGAPVDTAAEMIDLLIALEQPPFGRLTPEGWPETGVSWMNVGAMKTRVELASRVAQGALPSIPVESWPAWKSLSTDTFDRQVDGVIRGLLNGQVSSGTRAALMAARPSGDATSSEVRRGTLRELIALALSSPEFQRR